MTVNLACLVTSICRVSLRIVTIHGCVSGNRSYKIEGKANEDVSAFRAELRASIAHILGLMRLGQCRPRVVLPA